MWNPETEFPPELEAAARAKLVGGPFEHQPGPAYDYIRSGDGVPEALEADGWDPELVFLYVMESVVREQNREQEAEDDRAYAERRAAERAAQPEEDSLSLFELNYGTYDQFDGEYACDRCGEQTPGNGAYGLIFCPDCRDKCGLLLPD